MKKKVRPVYIVIFILLVIDLIPFTGLPYYSLTIGKGESAFPNLRDGDVTIARIDNNSVIHRGDYVLITNDEKGIVKRIVGMPGERAWYSDGKVYINGEVLEEEYPTMIGRNGKAVQLGDDEYYVLGDNRSNSKDSRSFGAVKKEQIKGKEILGENKIPIRLFNIYDIVNPIKELLSFLK